MPKADIAIITVIPEEYEAIVCRLQTHGCKLVHDIGTQNCINQFGWASGALPDVYGRTFQVVVAATLLPGQTRMANAVAATLARFNPRYVLLVGIAGGFPLDGLCKGDVAISSVIYAYEYGKIAMDFQPRHNFTHQVDGPLLRSAVALHSRDKQWASWDRGQRPDNLDVEPKLLYGAFASGEKVVDNADNTFFQQVLNSWPRLLAIEMEGAGAVSAIDEAKSANQNVGFVMVRGISDMPKLQLEEFDVAKVDEGNKAQRDNWKKYAAAVAASFTIHWILQAWPAFPAPPESDPTATDDNDDNRSQPLSSFQNRTTGAINQNELTTVDESSITLAFKRASTTQSQVTIDLSRFDPSLCRMILEVVAQYSDGQNQQSASLLDAELEAIKGTLDRHEPEATEVKLEELEVRAGAKLLPHQWYQLKILWFRLFSDRWQWEKAGQMLLEAKRHMPGTERARINEALGYELLGERDKAHALASELRVEFPNSERLLIIWVRTAPATASFDSLVAIAAGFANCNEELNLALAHRAFVEQRFDDALPFAKRATELAPESPHAWFILGEAKHSCGYKVRSGNQITFLREAQAHYDLAIQLAGTQKLPGLLAAIRFDRAKVRHLLGDQRAEADFLAAVEQGRPDQGFRIEYAGFLLEEGRFADALRELGAEKGEPTGNRLFYEAAARYERNIGDDRVQANQLLRKAILLEPFERWADSHILLVQWALENSESDAQANVDSTKLREMNPLVYHTLCGWISKSKGEIDKAKAQFREALNRVTDREARTHLFLLAQALVSIGGDEHALPLLERCYRTGVLNDECKRLLDCARRLERHDVVISVCRELRQAGAANPRVVEMEINVLQLYDPRDALNIAREYLADHPDERVVALWLSTLAIRLDRRELIIADLSRLPAISDLTPQGNGLILNVLCATGQFALALKHAYETLRVHFDQEFAHGQFIMYFLQLARHCSESQSIFTAGAGTAVCLRREHQENDRWLIIENSPEPDLARDEYGPDHAVSKALIGRTVGETVAVSDSSIQQRNATICHVLHKYVYRYQDCRDCYQIRFPGGTAIQLVYLGSGDEFDPTPIIRSLEDRKKHIAKLDELYRSQPIPFASYADWAGCNEFEAWVHFATTPDLGIRCFDGQPGELESAIDLTSTCKNVVVDMTALITLAHLNLLRLLQGKSRTFVVSQTTFDHVQQLIEKAYDNEQSVGTVVLTDDGELGRTEVTKDQRNRHVAFISSIRDAVRDNCQILPCPLGATLDPKRRRTLIEAIGRHGLDSILLAAAPETVLWTDDLILGVIGRTDFQARRVWTQVILFSLLQDKTIVQHEFDHAVAKLVGWNYQGIIWNEATLIAAAEIAEWHMGHWPVPQVMRCLGNANSDPIGHLRIAVRAIHSIWRRESLFVRQSFLFKVLSGLGSLRMIQRLHQEVAMVFSMDVVSAREVRDCIAIWNRLSNDLLSP